MLDRIREYILRRLPQGVRQSLPNGDRRRSAQWGMVAVGVFMVSLGKFAVWGSVDTLFTQSLARLGIETAWGLVMVSAGLLQIITAFVPWRTLLVATYGMSGIVMLWTYVLVGLIGGRTTPTIDACLGVGVVMLIAAVSKARQSVCIRAFQRTQRYGLSSD